jgi:hypothetical protein
MLEGGPLRVEKSMQTIENQVSSGKTITLDEKHFINCRFTDCKLVYSGGDYGWTDTTFENCQVTLAGAAQRTATLLGSFGALGPGGAPQRPAHGVQ